MFLLQDSDGEKSDQDLVVDDENQVRTALDHRLNGLRIDRVVRKVRCGTGTSKSVV